MRELAPWLRLIFRRPGRLIVGGALILITLLSGISLLALSGWFITETALVGLLLGAGAAASINLYVPGGGIRFFAIARTVSRYLERVYNHDTVLRLLTDIRVALFRKLAATARRDRPGLTGAQWLSRLTSDVDALDTLYLRLIAPTALAALATLLILLTCGWLFDGTTALAVAGFLGAGLVVATLACYWRTQPLASRQSDRQEALRTAVIEHLEGFSELTAAGRTGKHAAWLLRQAHQVTGNQAKIDTRAGWHEAVTHGLINLAAAVALWAGLSLYQSGAVSGPVLVLLPIALLGLAEAYAALPAAFARLGAVQSSAARLNNDCVGPETPANPRFPSPESLPGGFALVASDLSVRYPGHSPVLTHFDLQVGVAERLGVVGDSGSGKSSLADTFAGLLTPAHGEVNACFCAYLTQQTVIFNDTLRANLALARPAATDTELWRVLELVELADAFRKRPEGLDNWLGVGGSELSGGEARRVALARVLLSPAPLVLLDEPFTGLDPALRERISGRLDTWFEGKAVIALAHGPDALPGTDRVIHLTG